MAMQDFGQNVQNDKDVGYLARAKKGREKGEQRMGFYDRAGLRLRFSSASAGFES